MKEEFLTLLTLSFSQSLTFTSKQTKQNKTKNSSFISLVLLSVILNFCTLWGLFCYFITIPLLQMGGHFLYSTSIIL